MEVGHCLAACKDCVHSLASAEPLAIDAPMAGVDVQLHARYEVTQRNGGLAILEPLSMSHRRGSMVDPTRPCFKT